MLLDEAVPYREEVPAALLVELPHVGLLARVLCVRLVDQVHDEEPGQGQNSTRSVSAGTLLVCGTCTCTHAQKQQRTTLKMLTVPDFCQRNKPAKHGGLLTVWVEESTISI